MKTWLQKTAFLTVAISVLAVSRGAAQGEIVPVPLDAPDKAHQRSHIIRLQNVKPTVMAFWLDPKNHAAAPELAVRGGNKSPFPAQILQIPQGVDRIVPLDALNALLVFGTEAGADEVREIVAFLDRPSRRIEVETMLISIQNASLQGMWADLAAKAGDNRPAMGLWGDYEKPLSEMLARNEARILASRQLNFINNATQIFDFGPPSPDDYISPRLTIPHKVPEDFSAPMPVIPAPKGMAEMPGVGRITPQIPPLND